MSNVAGLPQFLIQAELRRDAIPSFDVYPFSLPAVRKLHTLEFHPKVTFLIGDNGTGKSTLMEAMAVAYGLNAEGGSKNFSFSTRAAHSDLHEFIMLRRGSRRAGDAWFLRAESFYNVASEIEKLDDPSLPGPPIINSYGGRSLHEQSHGESFMALFENQFNEGLYLLDEPEAALSPMRQMTFLTQLMTGSSAARSSSSPRTPPSSWRTRTAGSTQSAAKRSSAFRIGKPITTR